MKRRDIMIKILAEVTGRAERDVAELMDVLYAAKPKAAAALEEELPDDEAEKLMARMRAEGPGILARLMQGAVDVTGSGSDVVQ